MAEPHSGSRVTRTALMLSRGRRTERDLYCMSQNYGTNRHPPLGITFVCRRAAGAGRNHCEPAASAWLCSVERATSSDRVTLRVVTGD